MEITLLIAILVFTLLSFALQWLPTRISQQMTGQLRTTISRIAYELRYCGKLRLVRHTLRQLVNVKGD